MNQALFGLNQAVAQRSYNRVSGGGFRIGRYAPRNFVQSAKRDARLIRECSELSEVVVLDGLADEVHRIHPRMLPTAGNKSNQRLRISPTENSLQNPTMDTTEIRRRNLQRVIDERYSGKKSAFADAYEMPRPNVTQLIRGPRAFGNEIARKIEEREGMRHGWMDEEVPLTDAALSLSRRFMLLCPVNQAKLIERLEELIFIESAQAEADEIRRSLIEQEQSA